MSKARSRVPARPSTENGQESCNVIPFPLRPGMKSRRGPTRELTEREKLIREILREAMRDAERE